MVTNAMKTDAQRLGNGKKAFDVKQVEKMIESAGGSYTAGTGIDITDNEISVDTTAIQEKLTAGNGISISEQNVISVIGGSGYTLYTSKDWSELFEYTASQTTNRKIVAKKDMVIVFNVYIKSGTYVCISFIFKKDIVYYRGIIKAINYLDSASNALYIEQIMFDPNNNFATSADNVGIYDGNVKIGSLSSTPTYEYNARSSNYKKMITPYDVTESDGRTVRVYIKD